MTRDNTAQATCFGFVSGLGLREWKHTGGWEVSGFVWLLWRFKVVGLSVQFLGFRFRNSVFGFRVCVVRG